MAYVVSPLSVWCGGAMVGLIAWAGRGLSERERRCLWGLLIAAATVRLLAIFVLFVVSDPNVLSSFPWDGDGVYLKRRSLTIQDVWQGVSVSQVHFSRGFDHGYGWSAYLWVIAYLQYLTGPAPFGVHVFNVTLYLAAAVIMHRLTRAAYGRAPAFAGLALMLFLPTLIAWSVSALKESLYVFLCVIGVTAAISAIRASSLSARVIALAVVVGATMGNGTVRSGGSAIMTAGLLSGMAGGVLVRRRLLLLMLVVCLPFGLSRAWEIPEVQARVMSQIRASAVMHRGNVMTEGQSYKLLESRFYTDLRAVETMRPDEALRFVVRALVSVVVVPLPWQVVSSSGMVFLAQQVVWYLLVIFACVGFVAGLRRDPLVTCMLTGLSIISAVAIALNSGNVGTMIRFRDTFVPFVVWLSAVGAVSAAARLAFHGHAHATTTTECVPSDMESGQCR
jgi:hypothetical protein